MPILSTVKQFTEKQPAFTTGGLRSLIFNEKSNGLAACGAIIRIGRKVLINDSKFLSWVESQSSVKTTAESETEAANHLKRGVQV